MRPAEHRTLCGLVAKLIPTLDWRHSGLGMLQAYVHEGTDREMRVHLWHSSLRRKGIEESGLFHDHRFDLYSQVLVGQLRQAEHELTADLAGGWQLHEVLHARAAADGRAAARIKGAPFHSPPTPLPQRYRIETKDTVVVAGQAYSFPKREFHGTYPETDLVVTLVTKSNQEDFQARILAPHGKPIVHAFSDPLPPSEWKPVLALAAVELERRGRKWVNT